MVGKVLEDLPEDDPRNPAVVADLVGDLVGDVAGMSADLLGSFAEASVSALVLSSVSSIGLTRNWTAILYPLHLSAVSILVCALVTVFGTDMFSPRVRDHIAPTLKGQVLASTSLMAAAALPLTLAALPPHITGVFAGDPARTGGVALVRVRMPLLRPGGWADHRRRDRGLYELRLLSSAGGG